LPAGERDLRTGGGGKLPVVHELDAGEDEIDQAIALALEDVGVSGGELEGHGAAEDGLGDGPEDEGVFQAGSEVGAVSVMTVPAVASVVARLMRPRVAVVVVGVFMFVLL
jgi:hypothetical protein